MESNLVRFGIPVIALLLAALLVLGVSHAERRLGTPARVRARRTLGAALGVALYLAVMAAAALSGVLTRFDLRPPPFLVMILAGLGVALAVSLSAIGARLANGLPLVALVGFQAFRLPLELIMHRAANDGLMPSVMSWGGYNFDVLSGLSAVLVASLLAFGAAPRWLVIAWNLCGAVLLAVITAVAIAASPLIRAFGDDQVNVWVTRFPYTWMIVMVAAALSGHVLLTRRLRADARGGESTRSEPQRV